MSTLFLSCFLLSKKVYTQETKRETCPFLVPRITSYFNSFIAALSPALHLTLKHLRVFILSLSSSRFYTFSPCLPFFCSLIFFGYECALLDCPHCPFTLSVLPRISPVAMVTSLPPCWKTSLCSHKKRYLPHSRVTR